MSEGSTVATTDSRSVARRPRAWQVGLAAVSVALVAAACGSSTPAAKNKNSGSSTTTTSASSGATTSTTSGAAAGGTTTTAAGSHGGSGSGSGSGGGSCTTTLSQSCDTQAASASLTGAGSTFDQPLFSRAFYSYNQANHSVSVSYAAVGSGTGISDIQSQTVDFGATDVPLSPPSGQGGNLLEIPVALGGVAVAYNVPGVAQGLKLTGQTLVNIYLGKVTNWNDQAIASQNPGVNLPNQAIVTVHRADSSGTSYIFTDYLNHVDPSWSSSGPGVSKSPTWSKGASNSLGGNGNPGVAADVANTQYSIGYVELAYALQGSLTYAQMQNASGSFVTPTLSSVSAAASQFPNVSYQSFSIVNAPGSGSYPIAGYSWALVYQNQTNQSKGIALGKLFDWETSSGQSSAAAIGYAPLPGNVAALAHSTILQMQYNGKALFTG
ncbi:MAG: phosphate ABC transporter substrate-binding protein PstS [Acidimicrobiales bacterium]